MPRGAGRPFRPLEQHHVVPAAFRQVVERAHADHAATDHHHARMRTHPEIPPLMAGDRPDHSRTAPRLLPRSLTTGGTVTALIATAPYANASARPILTKTAPVPP